MNSPKKSHRKVRWVDPQFKKGSETSSHPNNKQKLMGSLVKA